MTDLSEHFRQTRIERAALRYQNAGGGGHANGVFVRVDDQLDRIIEHFHDHMAEETRPR